ncbi:MAG: acyloxyacyl hydrolase [Pararhodobacter sp.]|nr:acyloxyacyl hydrolase [Pararhodobacter sp.]
MSATIKTTACAALLACGFAATPALSESPALTFALGYNDSGSTEAFIGWRGAPLRYGFQPIVGASLSTDAEGWVGAGVAYTWRAAQNPAFVRLGFMPGLYRQGRGKDLGGLLEFRSSLEVGMQMRGGGELALGIAHRSNAGIYRPNPGLNTVYLGYSIALN